MGTPNYSLNPRIVPHYYDLGAGELITGENAYKGALRKGADIEKIHSLGSLLLDGSIEIEPGQCALLDVDDWTLQRYRKFGQWLHLATTPADEPFSNVTKPVLTRAYSLGIGPHFRRMTVASRFGSLDNFYQEAGINPRYRRGLYDGLPRDRFVDYVVDAFMSKPPHKTVTEVLKARAATGQNPGPDVITRVAGSISSLLAERGFPDIRRWTQDDFTDWGVTFMAANDGLRPTRYHLDHLSKKHRGPAAKTICDNFDYLSHYQQKVKEEYERGSEYMSQRLEERIEILRQQRKGSVLVVPVMRAPHTPSWLGLRVGAQFLLLDALRLPGLSADRLEMTATLVRQQDYVGAVLRSLPGTTSDQLRAVAQKLGVEEDIWPVHNPEYLRISAA